MYANTSAISATQAGVGSDAGSGVAFADAGPAIAKTDPLFLVHVGFGLAAAFGRVPSRPTTPAGAKMSTFFLVFLFL